MRSWLLRGLLFAVGMVVVRLVQGTLINMYETKAGLISIVLVVLFGIAAFVWGLFDGRADAEIQEDPDRRRDLAMTWLLAGLVAGVLSGFVAWLISLVYRNLYAEGLVSELTTFAAFTALATVCAKSAGSSPLAARAWPAREASRPRAMQRRSRAACPPWGASPTARPSSARCRTA